MKKLMIYGAAGYTGGMAAEHATSAGLDLVLAGREKDRRALEALAEPPVTLPDLLTIHQATGVAHIETFVHVAEGALPTGNVQALPAGPSIEERAVNRYHAAVEVTGADGTVARSVLDTVNGYTFTSMAAAEAARRVLAGEVRPGFQTPAGLFGYGFAETIADTRITDMTLKDAQDRRSVESH
jgi:short subunit dehydrogenase-like uncharacterized protein